MPGIYLYDKGGIMKRLSIVLFLLFFLPLFVHGHIYLLNSFDSLPEPSPPDTIYTLQDFDWVSSVNSRGEETIPFEIYEKLSL